MSRNDSDLRFNAVLEDNVSPKVDAIANKMKQLGASKHEIKIFIRAYDEASAKAAQVQDQLKKLPKEHRIHIVVDHVKAMADITHLRNTLTRAPIEVGVRIKHNLEEDTARIKQAFSNMRTQIAQEVAAMPIIPALFNAGTTAINMGAGALGLPGLAGAAGVGALAQQSFSVNMQREQDLQSLRTTLRDLGVARQEMSRVSQFAARTPFNQPDVLQADIAMRQYGIRPSGPVGLNPAANLAAGTGQDLSRAMLAIIDATRRGDFRVARGMGLNVDAESFAPGGRFQGMSIEQGLGKLINQRFGGAMEYQAKTFSGLFSNVQDVTRLNVLQPLGATGFGLAKQGLETVNERIKGTSPDALTFQKGLGRVVEAIDEGVAKLYEQIKRGQTIFTTYMLEPLKEVGRAVSDIGRVFTETFGHSVAGGVKYIAQAFLMILQPLSKIGQAIPLFAQLFGYMKAFQMLGADKMAAPFERFFSAINPMTFSIRNLFGSMKDLLFLAPRFALILGVKNFIDMKTSSDALTDSFKRLGNEGGDAIDRLQFKLDALSGTFGKTAAQMKQIAAEVKNAIPDANTGFTFKAAKQIAGAEQYGFKNIRGPYLEELKRQGGTSADPGQVMNETVQAVRAVSNSLNVDLKTAVDKMAEAMDIFVTELADHKGKIGNNVYGAAITAQMLGAAKAAGLDNSMITGTNALGKMNSPQDLVKALITQDQKPAPKLLHALFGAIPDFKVTDYLKFAKFPDFNSPEERKDRRLFDGETIADRQRQQQIARYNQKYSRLTGLTDDKGPFKDINLPMPPSQFQKYGVGIHMDALKGPNSTIQEYLRLQDVADKVAHATEKAAQQTQLLMVREQQLNQTQAELSNRVANFQHQPGGLVDLQRNMSDLNNEMAIYQQQRIVPVQRAQEDWAHVMLKTSRALEDVSYATGKAQYDMQKYGDSMFKGEEAINDQIHALDMYQKRLEMLRAMNQTMTADLTKTQIIGGFKSVVKPLMGFSLEAQTKWIEQRRQIAELNKDLRVDSSTGKAIGDLEYEIEKIKKRATFAGSEFSGKDKLQHIKDAATVIHDGMQRTRELTDVQHVQIKRARDLEDAMYDASVGMRHFQDQQFALTQHMHDAEVQMRRFEDASEKVRKSLYKLGRDKYIAEQVENQLDALRDLSRMQGESVMKLFTSQISDQDMGKFIQRLQDAGVLSKQLGDYLSTALKGKPEDQSVDHFVGKVKRGIAEIKKDFFGIFSLSSFMKIGNMVSSLVHQVLPKPLSTATGVAVAGYGAAVTANAARIAIRHGLTRAAFAPFELLGSEKVSTMAGWSRQKLLDAEPWIVPLEESGKVKALREVTYEGKTYQKGDTIRPSRAPWRGGSKALNEAMMEGGELFEDAVRVPGSRFNRMQALHPGRFARGLTVQAGIGTLAYGLTGSPVAGLLAGGLAGWYAEQKLSHEPWWLTRMAGRSVVGTARLGLRTIGAAMHPLRTVRGVFGTPDIARRITAEEAKLAAREGLLESLKSLKTAGITASALSGDATFVGKNIDRAIAGVEKAITEHTELIKTLRRAAGKAADTGEVLAGTQNRLGKAINRAATFLNSEKGAATVAALTPGAEKIFAAGGAAKNLLGKGLGAAGKFAWPVGAALGGFGNLDRGAAGAYEGLLQGIDPTALIGLIPGLGKFDGVVGEASKVVNSTFGIDTKSNSERFGERGAKLMASVNRQLTDISTTGTNDPASDLRAQIKLLSQTRVSGSEYLGPGARKEFTRLIDDRKRELERYLDARKQMHQDERKEEQKQQKKLIKINHDYAEGLAMIQDGIKTHNKVEAEKGYQKVAEVTGMKLDEVKKLAHRKGLQTARAFKHGLEYEMKRRSGEIDFDPHNDKFVGKENKAEMDRLRKITDPQKYLEAVNPDFAAKNDPVKAKLQAIEDSTKDHLTKMSDMNTTYESDRQKAADTYWDSVFTKRDKAFSTENHDYTRHFSVVDHLHQVGWADIIKTTDGYFSKIRKQVGRIDDLTNSPDDKRAAGGVVGSAMSLGKGKKIIVGEEGHPEVIIPLAPHRRDRAKSLIRQTRSFLGDEEKFANGGFTGPYGSAAAFEPISRFAQSKFGLTMTAGRIGHSYFTSSGNVSDHTTGMAGDFSNGKLTPEEDAFNSFWKKKMTKVIKQLIWRNRDQFTGYPISGHEDHVHLAILENYGMDKHRMAKMLSRRLKGLSIEDLLAGGDGNLPELPKSLGRMGTFGKHLMKALTKKRNFWNSELDNSDLHGSGVFGKLSDYDGHGGMSSEDARNYGKAMAAALGWTGKQWNALDNLWKGESGWRWWADNPSSDAYGIPQSNPGLKMMSAGKDWRTNAATQIKWGLNYIKGTYGDPQNAYETWLGRSPHWYANGGFAWGGWHANGGDFMANGRTMIGVGEAGPERVSITPLAKASKTDQHLSDIKEFLKDQAAKRAAERSHDKAERHAFNFAAQVRAAGDGSHGVDPRSKLYGGGNKFIRRLRKHANRTKNPLIAGYQAGDEVDSAFAGLNFLSQKRTHMDAGDLAEKAKHSHKAAVQWEKVKTMFRAQTDKDGFQAHGKNVEEAAIQMAKSGGFSHFTSDAQEVAFQKKLRRKRLIGARTHLDGVGDVSQGIFDVFTGHFRDRTAKVKGHHHHSAHAAGHDPSKVRTHDKDVGHKSDKSAKAITSSIGSLKTDRARWSRNSISSLSRIANQLKKAAKQADKIEKHLQHANTAAKHIEGHLQHANKAAGRIENHLKHGNKAAGHIEGHLRDANKAAGRVEGHLRDANRASGRLENHMRDANKAAGRIEGHLKHANEFAGKIESHFRDANQASNRLEDHLKDANTYANRIEGHLKDANRFAGSIEKHMSDSADSSSDIKGNMRDSAKASKNIETHIKRAADALNDATENVPGFKKVDRETLKSINGGIDRMVKGFKNVFPDKGFAGGLRRVPYDNFAAFLHQDEMILSAGEASVYRNRKSPQMSTARMEAILTRIADDIAGMKDNQPEIHITNNAKGASLQTRAVRIPTRSR